MLDTTFTRTIQGVVIVFLFAMTLVVVTSYFATVYTAKQLTPNSMYIQQKPTQAYKNVCADDVLVLDLLVDEHLRDKWYIVGSPYTFGKGILCQAIAR